MAEFQREIFFSCSAPNATSFEDAVSQLKASYIQQLLNFQIGENEVVLQRFFCSDVYTQSARLQNMWPLGSIGQRIFLGQSPLNSAFISLFVYAIKGSHLVRIDDQNLLVQHGEYTSYWTKSYPSVLGSAEVQCDDMISLLKKQLKSRNLTLEDDVIRTWYYVRDIDNNYSGMVRSRVRHYENVGLCASTHFIASTGIEATSHNPHDLVFLHSLSEFGIGQEQIRYLKALNFLSPTHVYGVNFERATCIKYGDRIHCHISGTASIDSEGNVLFPGDICRQCCRALQNIEALLNEAGIGICHLRSVIVYLRDWYDYRMVFSLLKDSLPADCACIFTRASVCRPEWLVEIEGVAVAPAFAPYPAFA